MIQASGYLSLNDVMSVLLMPRDSCSAATMHYLAEAYWNVLRHTYFATDTKNTRAQVQVGQQLCQTRIKVQCSFTVYLCPVRMERRTFISSVGNGT